MLFRSRGNVISNPPFNAKWNRDKACFTDSGLIPKGNANYAFILQSLEAAQGLLAFILPRGCLGGEQEKNARQFIIDNALLVAVIALPPKMFVSTSIPTCVLVFNNQGENDAVIFADLTNMAVRETREQRGQFGGKSHTNRVYKKEYNAIPDDIANQFPDLVAGGPDVRLPDYAVRVSHADIKARDYILSPKMYLPQIASEKKSRELELIVDDLNRTAELRNVLWLVINHSLAKKLGFDEVAELQDKSRRCAEDMREIIQKITGRELVEPDYILLTKQKNELAFQNRHPEIVSEIFLSILQMYKAHLMFLNNEENRYLAELRDALLPKLRNGEIDLA